MKSFTMQAALLAFLPVVSAISYQMNYSAAASPVQKVVELLRNMVAQGQKEMQTEKVQFATYSQWCKMTRETKTAAVEEAGDEIESLKAQVEKFTADAERLSSEIQGHQKDMESLAQEKDQLTKIRDQEATDYNAAARDYAESISAVSRAVATLKKQAYDRKQAAKAATDEAEESLIELSPLATLHSQSSVRDVHDAITAFIQQNKKAVSSKPKVAAYEFQSSGIIKMLSELQDKFRAEKVDLEKAEFNKRSSYEATEADLQNEADAEKKDLDKKAIFKQKKLSSKAKLEDQLSTTTDTKKSDEQYLDEVSTTCDQKAADFKSRQKLRADELEAVSKAIEVMNSDDVMANERKHLWNSFLQVRSKSETSLAVRRLRQARSDVKEKVMLFLQREGERIQSSALSKLALAVNAAADNDDTMAMIKNMLTKLLDDLQERTLTDQTKKDACDKKLAVNKQTRSQKTASTEELQADIDVLQSEISKLGKQIIELTVQAADIDSTVKNATAIRNAEKAQNAETISDAQGAQAAVVQATSVLREFYERAGQAAALLQKSGKGASLSMLQKSGQPEVFDAPYKGMGGESGGVIGMLEVIASDFAKLEAETKSEEDASTSEFKKFLGDSKLNRAQITTDIKHKKEVATDSKARISEKSSEFDLEEQALKASLAEYDALKEECLNAGLDYEEEKKRREETVESLQKALTMLNDVATGVTDQR